MKKPNLFESDSFKLIEGSTAELSFYLMDDEGEFIALADINSLKLNYYDKKSNKFINGRNDQNVLNDNNVTVDSDGKVTWNIQVEDTVISNEDLKTRTQDIYGYYEEIHIAKFAWTCNLGASTQFSEIVIPIQKLDTPSDPS